MNDNVITIVAPCCAEELAMPECWRGAPIGDELLRLHFDSCELLKIAVERLVPFAEVYANGGQCLFERRTVAGAVFRCQRFQCDSFHDVRRVA